MMPLLFSDAAHSVREGERLDEVLKRILSAQSRNAVR